MWSDSSFRQRPAKESDRMYRAKVMSQTAPVISHRPSATVMGAALTRLAPVHAWARPASPKLMAKRLGVMRCRVARAGRATACAVMVMPPPCLRWAASGTGVAVDGLQAVLVARDVGDEAADSPGRRLPVAEPDRPQVTPEVELLDGDTVELAARDVVAHGERADDGRPGSRGDGSPNRRRGRERERRFTPLVMRAEHAAQRGVERVTRSRAVLADD